MSVNDWLGESTKSSHCCQISRAVSPVLTTQSGIIFCLQRGGDVPAEYGPDAL